MEKAEPGDGLCLTHSLLEGEKALGMLAPGVKLPSTALSWELRDEVELWLQAHGQDFVWQDWTMTEWLAYELGVEVEDANMAQYVASMCDRSVHPPRHAGALEILAYMFKKRRSVSIFERVPMRSGCFLHLQSFDYPFAGSSPR